MICSKNKFQNDICDTFDYLGVSKEIENSFHWYENVAFTFFSDWRELLKCYLSLISGNRGMNIMCNTETPATWNFETEERLDKSFWQWICSFFDRIPEYGLQLLFFPIK